MEAPRTDGWRLLGIATVDSDGSLVLPVEAHPPGERDEPRFVIAEADPDVFPGALALLDAERLYACVSTLQKRLSQELAGDAADALA